MGATMVNLSSGAKTRVSGIIEGVLVLVAALVLNTFIAWIPIATLAGILIVVGLRMIDTEPPLSRTVISVPSRTMSP